MKKDLLILGAGYAGIEAAKTLNQEFKKNDSITIILIDQNPYHTLLTEIHEVAGNRIKPKDVTLSLEDIFNNTKVNLIQDKIKDINPKKQKLISNKTEYNYDYLILGAGSEPDYFDIPGLKKNSFTLWSLEDAKKINNHVRNMFKLASNEQNLQKREKMLTFAIGGGGFTGVEIAGEIAEWSKSLCKQYNISPKEVNIKLLEAKEEILPVLNENQAAKARNYLTKKLGVEVLTRSYICEALEDGFIINDPSTNCEERKQINTYTPIWTGGIKAKKLIDDLEVKTDEANRVVVNDYLQTSKNNIFAAGDNAHFNEESKPLPQLVEAALQGGECAAHNIAAQIKKTSMKKFNPQLHGVMVSVGANYGVAELKPTSNLTIPLSGFPAIMSKHMVNLHYLFGVNKLKGVGNYIKHQFKNVQGGIGMLVRHFLKKSGTFWLAFLRIFLGIRFLIEGINKFNKGWLFDSKGHLVSGASSVLWTDATPQWYVKLAKTFIVPNQILFQKLIVLGEFAVGLSLFFGFLTVLGAIGAIGMSTNFIMGSLGAQGVWGPIWMLLISIAMLSGAGKAFGLDYYVIPWLFNLSDKTPEYKKNTPA